MSTVFILHFAPSLRFTLSLQSAFYTQSAFHHWSAVCSLQSAVHSLRFTLAGLKYATSHAKTYTNGFVLNGPKQWLTNG